MTRSTAESTHAARVRKPAPNPASVCRESPARRAASNFYFFALSQDTGTHCSAAASRRRPHRRRRSRLRRRRPPPCRPTAAKAAVASGAAAASAPPPRVCAAPSAHATCVETSGLHGEQTPARAAGSTSPPTTRYDPHIFTAPTSPSPSCARLRRRRRCACTCARERAAAWWRVLLCVRLPVRAAHVSGSHMRSRTRAGETLYRVRRDRESAFMSRSLKGTAA